MVSQHSDKADIIVVGGGICGMGAAYALASRGQDVLLLEMEGNMPFHSTGRSAALFSETYADSEEFAAASTASKDFFFNPPEGFTDTPLVTPRDTLYVAEGRHMVKLNALYAKMQDYPARTSKISGQEAENFLPVLKPGFAAGAILETGSGDLDVMALWDGYRRACIKQGVRILKESEVLSIKCSSFSEQQVITRQGEYKCRIVVNAAGAWGDELLRRSSLKEIGLQPYLRTAMEIRLPDEMRTADLPFCFLKSDDLYFRISGGRALLSPADETASQPMDVSHDEITVAETIERFEDVTGVKMIGRPISRWAGLRTFAKDRNAVIGFHPEAKGMFLLLGQGGYGIQSNPAFSQAAAGMILDGGFPKSITEFGISEAALSPNRFFAREMSDA